LGEALRVVHAFVSGQAAEHRLPQQVGEEQTHILLPRLRQVLLDEFAEAQLFLQLQHQNHTSVGNESRPLKIERQGSVEPPEGFSALSSRVNTGDAHLLHLYHRFPNQKSGLKGLVGSIGFVAWLRRRSLDARDW
jgi:hypothetical protein